ncbi:DUF4389 domain-containing protein [Microbulbifer aggregans]|uniref:DUF4389 domain-containing protein n=1 Tax=Microbulbifer aggregans TaxID=1769779 RepID=UPI001CFF1752|nr:DUF4389 domain-containing protein [Microbulbifer aggregans]
MSNEELKQNLTSANHWIRLVYMVLFAVLLEIAGFVMLAVVIAQFLFNIITGSANDNLRRLGDQLASYIYQTLQFLIYNTEDKPFPFSEWPESEVDDLSSYESAEEVDGEVISEYDEVESDIEIDDEITDEVVEEVADSDVIELGAEDVAEEPAAKPQAESKADVKPDAAVAGSSEDPAEEAPATQAPAAKKAKSTKAASSSKEKAGEADTDDTPEKSGNDK